RTGRPLESPPSWTRRLRPSGARTVESIPAMPGLDHGAGHRDRLDLERDAVLARLKVAEFLARVAYREVVDDLMLGVRDEAHQSPADLCVALRHFRIAEEHGEVGVPLKILR